MRRSCATFLASPIRKRSRPSRPSPSRSARRSRFRTARSTPTISGLCTGIFSRTSTIGEARTIRTFKDGSPFCFPESFDQELGKLFGWLAAQDFLHGLSADAFAAQAAHFLSELNAIHLFREGNGRAQTAFLAMLAAEAGHPLDFERLDTGAWMHAMIVSFYNGTGLLVAQIRGLIDEG